MLEIGNRMGKLVIIADLGKNKNREQKWLCICDCGNTCERGENTLRRSRMSSCGCYKKTLLIPGDSARCTKAGRARAAKRNKDGINTNANKLTTS